MILDPYWYDVQLFKQRKSYYAVGRILQAQNYRSILTQIQKKHSVLQIKVI